MIDKPVGNDNEGREAETRIAQLLPVIYQNAFPQRPFPLTEEGIKTVSRTLCDLPQFPEQVGGRNALSYFRLLKDLEAHMCYLEISIVSSSSALTGVRMIRELRNLKSEYVSVSEEIREYKERSKAKTGYFYNWFRIIEDFYDELGYAATQNGTPLSDSPLEHYLIMETGLYILDRKLHQQKEW